MSEFGSLLALASNVEDVTRAVRDLQGLVVALFDVHSGASSAREVTYSDEHDDYDYWDVLSEREYATLLAVLVAAGRPVPYEDVIELGQRSHEDHDDHDDEQHD